MFESKINRGRANGYAPLDGSGKVPLDKLPPIQSTIDTGSLVTIDQTGSFVKNNQTSSFATTGSNLFYGNQSISGSLNISSSLVVSSTFVNNSNLYLSGSDLTIDSGSLSVSGSINVSGSVNVTNTFINRGTIDALNSDLIIEGGYLILTGSTIPTNLTGSVGDTKGMIVFDDNFLYYCNSDFIPQTYQIVVNNGTSYNTHVTIAKNQTGIPNLVSNGFSITTADNTTYVLTGVYSDGDNWDCEIDNLNSYYDGGTQTMTLTRLNYVASDIWSKIPYFTKTAPTNLSGSVGDIKGQIAFNDNYLYYCTSSYAGGQPIGVDATGITTHVFNKWSAQDWNAYGSNYLQTGESQENGGALAPVSGWYFVDDNFTIRQLIPTQFWAGNQPLMPVQNGAGWLCDANGPWVYSNSNPTITFYETIPTIVLGPGPDIWKRISLDGGGAANVADFTFTSQTITNDSITLHATNSDIILNADGGVYLGSANGGNSIVTGGYLDSIVGNTSIVNNGTGHTITDNLTNIINSIPSVVSLNAATSSYEIKGNGIISSSAQLPNGLVSGSSQLTSSFETIGRGIISSSAQLPSGLVSGSSQLTSSFETIGRGIISSSAQLPIGLISGSSQLTSSYDLRYQLSGSAGVVPAGTISSSVQLTSSYDGRYIQTGSYNLYTASINSFTSSHNIWSASVATTGSNSFSGSQTITGSLIVSSITTISSSIAANASSLTLSSGSNFYLQNNGVAQISGSLSVSGSVALTGSISISSGSITMPNRPAFRVIGTTGDRTAPLTLSGSLVSVDYNEGNYFSTTNGKFTAPFAGLYQVYYNGRVGSINSMQQVIVYKNSNIVQLMWEAPANTGVAHFGVSGICKLAVNDTLEAKVAVGTIQFDANDSWGVAYIG